jgi:prepilin-type N-terminal cleavage/methylation domain-containing protein
MSLYRVEHRRPIPACEPRVSEIDPLKIEGRSRAGFSMIELLVVVTIIGLLTVIAAPSFTDAMHKRETTAASDQFVMAHGLARSTALRYGRVSQLHIDPNNAKFWIDVDTSGRGERGLVTYVKSVDGGDLTMQSNRSLLCFDPHGLASTVGACQSGDALLTFASADKVDTVRITTLGKVLR